MTVTPQDDSMVVDRPQVDHYSEFETLYESVLFKKPELLTSEVFVNAINELKAMKAKLTEPSLEKDLLVVESLMFKLQTRVQTSFAQLDRESLAKLLISMKDKLQSKKPQESVGKIGKNILDYLNQIRETGGEKEGDKWEGKGKKTGKKGNTT